MKGKMNIIGIIAERGQCSGMDQKFNVLANEMVAYSAEHQKRVLHILPEFDLHDGTHSNAVEENIAQLIGGERLSKMSTVELFMLCMAAHLHDIGMAPSDWELEVMSLTEGSENLYEKKDSIKWDGKKPYSFAKAKEFIQKRKKDIYDFEEVRKNKFTPDDEEYFIDGLAKLFIDYQEYRNGYVDHLRDVKDEKEYMCLSKSIRQEYVRNHHHLKSAEYIVNLQTAFERELGEVWPKGLVKDLSLVCRAHCEGSDFIKSLETDSHYYNVGSVNLQFVAEMLRLGDIVHFCADRAPVALRSSIKFESDFSFHQWMEKAGLNYTIDNNHISYTAYCQIPEDYYQLQEYCKWIDDEIFIYDTLKERWEEKYRFNFDLNRKDIKYDPTKFIPAVGKKITMNQNRILELLAGTQLYKDPYACLRELYQNSLDACRCRIDIEKSKGMRIQGEIEFGLGNTKTGEKYLYCLDNGIGMTKEIIENYLLKIGNSYYKSKEFYRRQSKWNCSFTPVSQFGIGILSCFMIADELNIVTRHVDNPNDCVSCCLDGAKEIFYYTTPKEEDFERITGAGTLVKLILKAGYAETLISDPIEKFGIMMAVERKQPYIGDYEKYNQYFDKWERHIYYHLNKFINKVPDGIKLQVRVDSKYAVDYVNKPFVVYGEDGVLVDDDSFLRYDNNIKKSRLYENYNHDQFKDYPICVSKNGIEHNVMISLPLRTNTIRIKRRLVGSVGYAVDGIIAHDGTHRTIDSRAVPLDMHMEKIGNINFVGIQRPKLSVDRESITEMPSDYENSVSLLAFELLKKVLTTLNEHIRFVDDSKVADESCECVFDVLFGATDIPFNTPLFRMLITHQELSQYLDIVYHPLSAFVGCEITLGQFIYDRTVHIKDYDYHIFLPAFLRKLIVSKLLMSSSIEMKETSLTIGGDISNYTIRDDAGYLLLGGENLSALFKEYDYVSSFFPFVPDRMRKIMKKEENERIISLSNYSGWDIDTLDCWFRFKKLDRMYIPLENLSGDLSRLPKRYMLLLFLVPLPFSIVTDNGEYDEEFIRQGCTVLLTGDVNNKSRRLSGKHSRQEMVRQLGDAFWEQNKDVDFFFLDDTPITRPV